MISNYRLSRAQLQLVQEQGNAQHNVKTKIVSDLALAQQAIFTDNAQLLADITATNYLTIE